MGRSRYKFTQTNAPYFMTLTVLQWLPVFTRPETIQILLDAFKYLANEGLKLYAYVVLENHVHLIAQSDKIDKDISRFKSFTAKKLISYLKENNLKMIVDQLAFFKKAHKTARTYQFWQEGVHPEQIQGEEMMRLKVEYIHNNPVQRGYVDRPEHWRYSSARNYLGMEGVIEVCRQW